MAAKFSSLIYSRKIFKWVRLKAFVSSISSASSVQMIPENDQNPSNSSEFESSIQILKNQPNPDALIRVLDSTQDLNSSLKLFTWVSLQKRFQHTAETYYKMVMKLGMAGKMEEMEGFCREMAKERFPGTEQAFVALIEFFVKHGRLNEALRVLMTMNLDSYKPPLRVFNVLLAALVDEKREFQEVLFVYKEMVKAGIVPSTDTLNYLLEALFESGRVDTALDQYRRMNKKRCSPNSRTFEILISRLVARKLVDESIDILDEMCKLEFEPGSSFYTVIIPLLCRLNKLDRGMKLFQMMKASKLSPDSQIFEVLIECLCENLRLSDAINLVDEMKNSGLTPSDDILVYVVECFCKSAKFQEAKKFLEEEHAFGSDPHNALLAAYCNANNSFAAEVLFASMLDKNIANTVSWNIIIRWLSENGGISRSLKFLCRMIVFSYIPDSTTYSAVVVGQCRLNKYEYAFKLFHQVCAKSWILDSASYSELLECLCRSEMVQEAAEVFYYMSKNRCTLELHSLTILVKGLCASGNIDGAAKLLHSAYFLGISCSTAIYNAIMLSLSKSDRVNDLLAMLSRMLIEGCTLDEETYNILIQTMIAFDRIKETLLFFNLMAGEGLSPDSETLTNLLLYLAQCSHLHKALVAIDKIFLNHEILNSAMYNILINGLWKEGYKSEAGCLLDKMLEKGWVPDASTHRLLMGSIDGEEAESNSAALEDINLPDKVSNILAEGLGET
ncbi:hypothetical protein NMG60_11020988 [Bertholletia excelsa]